MHTIAFTHETTGEGNPVPWGQMQHQFYLPDNAEGGEPGNTQSDNINRPIDPPATVGPLNGLVDPREPQVV